MALQGTLDTFALSDVLRLLAATKKTGRLRITGSRGTGSAWVTSGEVVAIEATHAPHATSPTDALFELLRFEEGSFTFDADASHSEPGPATEVEGLLMASEALLAEWRTIEAVVPSMDAWVTLRRQLPEAQVAIDQEQWTSIVAIGAGATVRRMAEDLCLAELPVSRAVKALVEAELVDVAPAAPAGSAPPKTAVGTAAPKAAGLPLLVSEADGAEATEPPPAPAPAVELDAPTTAPAASAPAARGPRARRARPLAAEASAPAEPERFVPLDLPGHTTASYDQPDPSEEEPAEDLAVDDLAAAFPGLANRLTPGQGAEVDEELSRQLATLSPRAAEAVRAAAEAETDEEREAALDDVDEGDETLNRGLLLKFLSSVKS